MHWKRSISSRFSCLIFTFLPTYDFNRIEIKARLRRLKSDPREPDRQKVETLRKVLGPMLRQLHGMQALAGVRETTQPLGGNVEEDNTVDWEYNVDADADDDPEPEAAPTAPDRDSPADAIPLEDQLIGLPSNGNIEGDYRHVELPFRIQQAKTELNRIRDLIAEKSFQYSHILRRASRGAVRTRSRSAIHQLTVDIALHARFYSRCRARMARLGADDATLDFFKILTKTDIKCSTAMRDPNIAGSKKLKLSWIWYNAAGLIENAAEVPEPDADADPATLLECEYLIKTKCDNQLIYTSQTCSLAQGSSTVSKMA